MRLSGSQNVTGEAEDHDSTTFKYAIVMRIWSDYCYDANKNLPPLTQQGEEGVVLDDRIQRFMISRAFVLNHSS